MGNFTMDAGEKASFILGRPFYINSPKFLTQGKNSPTPRAEPHNHVKSLCPSCSEPVLDVKSNMDKLYLQHAMAETKVSQIRFNLNNSAYHSHKELMKMASSKKQLKIRSKFIRSPYFRQQGQNNVQSHRNILQLRQQRQFIDHHDYDE